MDLQNSSLAEEMLLSRPCLCGKGCRVWLLIVSCLLCCRSGTITSMERLTAAAVSCCSKCMNSSTVTGEEGSALGQLRHGLALLGVLCRARTLHWMLLVGPFQLKMFPGSKELAQSRFRKRTVPWRE